MSILEKCKYKVKKQKERSYINDDIEISADDDDDDDDDDKSSEEDSEKKV